MEIEIWADVVCPWCYIGTSRLERALDRFEHRDEVEVVYRSFQLDPTAPTDGATSVVEHLGAAYGGGPEAGREMVARTEATAAEEGLTLAHTDSPWTNSRDAHRLLQLALDERGATVQRALAKALYAAYFERAQNIADLDVLAAVAAAAGLEAARVRDVLAGEEYDDVVGLDIEQARAFGANGVPFFVLDRRFGVSGAQPAEVFTQALEQAWAEGHAVG